MDREEENIRIEYVDRIKHVYSLYPTADDELAYAQTIEEDAEVIEMVHQDEDVCAVIVHTVQAVYHFTRFRTDYIGHASRMVVSMVAHFRVDLPLDFIIRNQTITVYIIGNKVAVGQRDYPLIERMDRYTLVESVHLLLSIRAIEMLLATADSYQVDPEWIVERLIVEKLGS